MRGVLTRQFIDEAPELLREIHSSLPGEARRVFASVAIT